MRFAAAQGLPPKSSVGGFLHPSEISIPTTFSAQKMWQPSVAYRLSCAAQVFWPGANYKTLSTPTSPQISACGGVQQSTLKSLLLPYDVSFVAPPCPRVLKSDSQARLQFSPFAAGPVLAAALRSSDALLAAGGTTARRSILCWLCSIVLRRGAPSAAQQHGSAAVGALPAGRRPPGIPKMLLS